MQIGKGDWKKYTEKITNIRAHSTFLDFLFILFATEYGRQLHIHLVNTTSQNTLHNSRIYQEKTMAARNEDIRDHEISKKYKCCQFINL